jgi:predicted HicB family RNase H-like nuclease
MIDYKGYTGIFEFDSDLRIFAGHVIDLRDEICFEGESVEELEESMKRAVDHYLEVCENRGEAPERPFSGKLNMRLGPQLHRAAAAAAAAEGASLNDWLKRVVADAAQAPATTAIRRRSSRKARARKSC